MASGHAAPSSVVGATIALTTLAAMAVLARLYTRFVIVKKAGLDDFFICVAIVFAIALTITMCEQVNYGMGRHFDTLSVNDKIMLFKWFWASVWIYYTSLCFTKLSILLQLLRVFTDNKFRIACYVLMGVIIAYSLGTVFSSIFSCVPVSYFWDKTIEGSCVDQTAVWFSNTAINIVTDICTAVLPIPTLKSLQLPKRQKYALMAVFALGGFTCIISILRLQSLYVVSRTTDISWDNPLAAIWSNAETNVGIICSCLPTLKGLVTRMFPRLFSATNSVWNSNHYDVRSGGSRSMHQQHRGSFNPADHELVNREKGYTKSYVSAGWENYQQHESSEPGLATIYPYDKHITVQTRLDQDTKRETDEITTSEESESLRRLVPPQSAYHMPGKAL